MPRTIESSIRISRFPRMSVSTGISFIRAMRFRFVWLEGINERGQVGVYLMNGREKGMPERLA